MDRPVRDGGHGGDRDRTGARGRAPERDRSAGGDVRGYDDGRDGRDERRTGDGPRAAGPRLTDEVRAEDLDGTVRAELLSLARPVAETVARHLVAAGRFIDEEPQEALAHALAARRLASRIAVVREAVGLAAYHADEWQTAIAELRTYHRMSGRQTHLAVLADCERALGRPDRAVDLYRMADRESLDPAVAIELLIVAAGARADLGQHDAAVAMLQVRELTGEGEPWSSRLRYAYAEALLAAGRVPEAREWFARTAAVDTELETDAAERLLELDGVALTEPEEDPAEDDDTPDDITADTSAEADSEASTGAEAEADAEVDADAVREAGAESDREAGAETDGDGAPGTHADARAGRDADVGNSDVPAGANHHADHPNHAANHDDGDAVGSDDDGDAADRGDSVDSNADGDGAHSDVDGDVDADSSDAPAVGDDEAGVVGEAGTDAHDADDSRGRPRGGSGLDGSSGQPGIAGASIPQPGDALDPGRDG